MFLSNDRIIPHFGYPVMDWFLAGYIPAKGENPGIGTGSQQVSGDIQILYRLANSPEKHYLRSAYRESYLVHFVESPQVADSS
jgi:hypothetical protein